MNFSEYLKNRLAELGWTQPAAAANAGIEQSYLSKLETGRSVPSDEVYQRLVEAIGINTAAMVSAQFLIRTRQKFPTIQFSTPSIRAAKPPTSPSPLQARHGRDPAAAISPRADTMTGPATSSSVRKPASAVLSCWAIACGQRSYTRKSQRPAEGRRTGPPTPSPLQDRPQSCPACPGG